MSPQTLEDSLTFLATRPGGERTRVLWFGGEPSLVPISLYEYGMEVCAKLGRHLWKHSVQTNGQNLTRDMVRFWRDHNVEVGISCDGPGDLTDSYRGRGAFANIVRSLDLLAQEGVSVGMLAVLHRANIDRLDEIVEFAKSRELVLKLSHMKRVGRARDSALDALALPPGAFAAAIKRLIDRWTRSGNATEFAAVHQWVAALVRGSTTVCMNLPDCQTGFGAIDVDGSVYPCARVFDQPDHRLGHVLDGWDACRASTARARFRHTVPAKCHACKFGGVCSGGCPLSDRGCGDTAEIWAHTAAVLTGETNEK